MAAAAVFREQLQKYIAGNWGYSRFNHQVAMKSVIMGNIQSKTDEVEDQDVGSLGSDSELAVEVQNGPVTQQIAPGVNSMKVNQVNLKPVVQQDNMITSSQKTIVISPISNGINTSQPQAQSKFRMTISRPAPGRTTFQANGPDVGKQALGGPVIIQTSNNPIVVQNSAQSIRQQAPPTMSSAVEVAPTIPQPNQVDTGPSNPKEISFFQKLFKPEKKVEFEVPLAPQNNEAGITVEQNPGLQSAPPSYNLPIQITDDSKQDSVQVLNSHTAIQSTTKDNINKETISESTQTTPAEEIHPVMSFFKTLVSPNKSVLKSEEEVKNEADEKKKENGGLRKSPTKKEKSKSFSEQTLDTEAKGSKKSDSPKTRTLGGFFRQKPKKEEQASGKVMEEHAFVSVSVNSEKSPAPEQILIQDPTLSESNVQSQIKEQTSKDDGKAAKESAPRSKLFWRKSFKGDPPSNKAQENVEQEQSFVSVSLNANPPQILTEDPNPNLQSQGIMQTSVEQGNAMKESTPRPIPFWRKAVQKPTVVSVSVNSDKSTPGQILSQDTNPNMPPQNTAQVLVDEMKPVKESPPRPIPFWRKSFKVDPPPVKIQETAAQEPTVTTVFVKSEKSAPGEILIQETNPNTQSENTVQIPENETKSVKETPPRPMPFWRMSFKGGPQPTKSQENSVKENPTAIQLTGNAPAEPGVQTSKANSDTTAAGSGGPETQEKGKKAENGKSAKPKLMMFFKQLSVIGDAGNINSEDGNQQSVSPPTLDITDGVEVSKSDKTVVSAVIETPPQKTKENSKEKKVIVEKLVKQESKESPEATISLQHQVLDPSPGQSAIDTAKDSQLKRTEKRQSLGNFFKAIGPKRMCDAEVQTDPVSILPAERVK
ncbi:breast carcinoma-amplified sequence 1 [Pelodytes ibericus]